MLPVLIYEPDTRIRAALLAALAELDGQGLPKTRVNLSTGSFEAMERAIREESGITLAMVGIPRGQCQKSTGLGSTVMQQNRNSYTLFCLHDPADLEALLDNCMRPAGIVTAPLAKASLTRNLRRILEDYQNTVEAPADDNCMVIEGNGTAYRIPYDRILYLEALNKLLTIHTERQSITVRRSLTGLEELLPEQFLRCHRAYVVNTQFIDRVNFTDMTLTLRNGDALPVSRGQRGIIKQRMDAQKGANL